MTAGSAALAAGFSALLGVHGEPLTRRSAADVVTTESGEVLTDEGQSPILAGNEDDEEFTGVFIEDYELVSPGQGGFSTTATVVMARTADIPDAARGDIITRDGTIYTVIEVQPDAQGMTALVLSKDAH